ncbi:MAG TPA: hypothetical protein VF292_15770 [Rhodanobacteraceae bacterium]
MRVTSAGLLLLLPWLAGTALATAPTLPKDQVVKTMALQAFFHAPLAWKLTVYQPVPKYGLPSRHPVRACFTRPPTDGGESYTSCSNLYAPGYVQGFGRYPCQRFDRATLEMLPGLRGVASRPSLVIRAHYASGSIGRLDCLFVWTFDAPRKKHPGQVGWFSKAFESDTDQTGQQEFIEKGPLAGTFVSVDQLWQLSPAEPNIESPMRFSIEVDAPNTYGYMKVLAFMTRKRYPNRISNRGTPNPIATLTPEIAHALRAIYPNGVASLMERRQTGTQ